MKFLGLSLTRIAPQQSSPEARPVNFGNRSLNRYSFFGPAGRRGWDAAANGRLTAKHWAGKESTRDADSEAALARPTLRQRARYEIRNNGYAKGMTETYADDLIGPGPTFTAHSGEDDYNEKFQGYFSRWANSKFVDYGRRHTLAGFLKLAAREFFRSGEAFFQIISDPTAPGPVKLGLLAIEADRITTPLELMTDSNVRDGIRIDPESGRPVEYYVLKQHPGFAFKLPDFSQDGFLTIPAAEMIHLFHPDRPGQTRGVPWISPVLDLFGQLRDYTGEVMAAARAAAMLCAFMHTNVSDLDVEELGKNLPVDDLEAMTLTTLPKGYGVTFSDPKQPNTAFKDFRREILSEAGRVVGMPYNIIAANSAGYNYSSSKMDSQIYIRGLNTVRRWIVEEMLDRVVTLFAIELRLSGALPTPAGIPPEDLNLGEWFWQPFVHADPSKEATALVKLLEAKVISLVEACQQRGRDWRKVLEEWKQVEDFAAELGLDLGKFFGAAAAPAAEEDEEYEDEEDEDAKKNPEAEE